MTFRIGSNCVLLETALDSNYEPIIHAGERVEIFDIDDLSNPLDSEFFLVRNKIDERTVVHRSKLTPVRGRPMRVIR